MQAILSVFLSLFFVFAPAQPSKANPGPFEVFESTITSIKRAFNTIGEINDYADFTKQMSKKVDLESYSLSTRNSNIGGLVEYTYENYNPYIPYYSKLFSVKIDQTEFSLPVPLAELVDLGWNIVEIGYNPVTEVDWSKKYALEIFTLKNASGNVLYASTGNAYASAVPLKDCLVTNINLSYYITSVINQEVIYQSDRLPNVPDVTLCGVLSTDSTLDNIITVLGAPHEIVFSEYSYTAGENLTHIELEYRLRTSSYGNAYLNFHIYPRKGGNFFENDFITAISFSADRY